MKTFSFVLISVLLLILPPVVIAQESAGSAIVGRLQQEIERREAVERDVNLPADLKEANRIILARRRSELTVAIQEQITALQKYLATLGDSITAEEREIARASLKNLAASTKSLEGVAARSSNEENSTNSQEQAVSRTLSLESSFVKPGSSTSKTALPSGSDAFVITSPSDKDKTSLSVIEVQVKLKAVATFGVQLKVSVKNRGKEVSAANLAVKAGEDTGKSPVTLKPGNNEITVSDSTNSNVSKLTTVTFEPDPKSVAADQEEFVDRFSSIYTRAIVGFEQSGASAAASKQKPFLEFFWNPPISTSEDQAAPYRFVYPRASLWGSVRLTSVPRQISSPLVTFAPGFLSPVNEANVNDLVQGFDFLAGAELGIGNGFRTGNIGTVCHPTGAPKTCQRVSSYLIGGFGAINPLSPSSSVQVFQRPTNPDDLKKLIGDMTLPSNIQYLAFASPDRDSFFRQYYAGFRIKTHYFLQDPSGSYSLINRPGAMLDVAVGQNEAVSGGKLRGLVLRLDGFYPLPVSDKSIFYLYGTALINLRRQATISDPVILATAPSNVTVPADNVFVITSPQSNRDVYRIGIGVNLIELFRKRYGDSPK
jgi:hypothetical protein